MRNFKSAFGMAGAIAPLFYCGLLIYYFLDISGSMQNSVKDGLSPTLMGLGVVGLLCCIPLIMKVVRLFARTQAAGSGPGAPSRDDESGFDADAAIARYMAQRSVEAAPGAPAARPMHRSAGPAKPGFGRRIR